MSRAAGAAPVAVLAEGEAVVEAADSGGLGEAAVANEGAKVATGEGVGGVDEAVAGEA